MKQLQITPPINVGDTISLTCLRGKAYGIDGTRGRKNDPRRIKGEVVYKNETFLTLQHQPAGWRECFLLTDIREGRVILLQVGAFSDKSPAPRRAAALMPPVYDGPERSGGHDYTPGTK